MTHNETSYRLVTGHLESGVRLLSQWAGTLHLNDLNKAYNQVLDLEGIVSTIRAGLGDLSGDYIHRSYLSEFYDDLTDAVDELSSSVAEVEHDLNEMIGQGWADDGHEDEVQEQIEDQILPSFEVAIDAFALDSILPTIGQHTEWKA